MSRVEGKWSRVEKLFEIIFKLFLNFVNSKIHRLVFTRVSGGEGKRRKQNGMWNGVRNGIIMRNTISAGNKLTEERILFSRQFYKSSSFVDVADY